MVWMARLYLDFKIEIEDAARRNGTRIISPEEKVDAGTKLEAQFIAMSTRMEQGRPARAAAGESPSSAEEGHWPKYIKDGGCTDLTCPYPHKEKKDIP